MSCLWDLEVLMEFPFYPLRGIPGEQIRWKCLFLFLLDLSSLDMIMVLLWVNLPFIVMLSLGEEIGRSGG
jgi:hypothetical protein